MNSRRNGYGFTLIELLVVIAIIAILAAILFPVMSATMEKGRQTKCMNNMKQLSMAMLRYIDDNSGWFPLCWTSGDWVSGTWRERLYPFLKSRSVFECTNKTYDGPQNGIKSRYWHYGICYGLTDVANCGPNFLNCAGVSWNAFFGTSNVAKLQAPSKTLMIAENKDGDWECEPMSLAGAGNNQGKFYPYHLRRTGTTSDYNGGGNFIWCDGHVNFMLVNASESLQSNGVRTYYFWLADKSWHINTQ